ncbi:hypothetical protein [Bacillus horti]|uniref:Multiple sugar transport system substrate-binding protein n=1 Tax=Caldalkalibacillus horti TaxID=77523 RepID=A0ABT9VZ35_9BACI|nr:hypothetical protein [Bacillus horti]MDQ0166255.1 multiple sugar transport system substrate-binding protein [Bacillus horti]
MMYSTGYVPTVSKQPELAWELLRELAFPSTSEARQKYWGAQITKSLAENQGRMNNPWWETTLSYMDRITKNAYLYSPIWNRSRQSMNEDLERMIKEGTDIRRDPLDKAN